MKSINYHKIKKGKLVLLTLMKYGVLNMKSLHCLIPEIRSRRNLERTVARLVGKQLIVKRYDQIDHQVGSFYQLNQRPAMREALALYLDCSIKDIEQRHIRYKELYHEQIVAQISYYLQKTFPDATIFREQNFTNSEEVKAVISNIENTEQPRPDLLLFFREKMANRTLAIAIEFERTQKSKIRLYHKLNFYTSKTLIDGVIYICSKSRIQNNLDEIYETKVVEKSLRIKQYGKNFLLTSVLGHSVEKSLSTLKNLNGESLDLVMWKTQLLNKDVALRRDKDFTKVPD